MGNKVWTPQMVDVLLDDIETNKGRNSVYIHNSGKALTQALQALAPLVERLQPPISISAMQISNKISQLIWISINRKSREQFVKKDLFERGRALLGPSFQTDALLSVRQESESQILDISPTRVALPVSRKGRTTILVPLTGKPRRKGPDSDPDFEPTQPSSSAERAPKKQIKQGLQTKDTPLPIKPTIIRETNEVVNLLEEESDSELSDATTLEPDVCIAPSGNDSADKEEHNVSRMNAEDCLSAVNEYMLDNPGHALPKTKKLHQNCAKLIEEIIAAVEELIMATPPQGNSISSRVRNPDNDFPPDIARALSRQAFYELCSRTYGASNGLDLDAKLGGSFVSTKDFIRALLGAAIDDWVFNNRHHHLPDLENKKKTAISEALEADLARSNIFPTEEANLATDFLTVHPYFVKDLIRKSLCRYVQTADFSNFTPPLTSLFINDTKGFLALNGIVLTGENLNTWSASLDKIFLMALNIRSHIQLHGKGSKFSETPCLATALSSFSVQ